MAFIDDNPICITPKVKKGIILKEYNNLAGIDLCIRDKFIKILKVMSRDIPFTSCKIQYVRDKLFVNLRLDPNYVFVIQIPSYKDYISIKMNSTSAFCFQQDYKEITVDQFNKGLTFSCFGGEYNKFKN